MNRQELYHCRIQRMPRIVLLFFTACLMNIAAAGHAIQPNQSSKDLKILYHEILDVQFQSASRGGAVLPPNVAEQDEGAETTVMSFDAFGQHFDLLLESNQNLIENLPQQQKEVLNKSLELFRGKLKNTENSWVRITREEGQISGMIWDGSEMFVIDHSQNVADALAKDAKMPSDYPMIYRLSDTESDGRSCATDSSASPINDYKSLVDELQQNITSLPQASSQLDIAIVADAQFVNNNANPDAAVVARMNVVDGIYSEQVGVRLNVTNIRALQNNGGLSSSNPGTLLDQFGNFSNSSGFNNPGLAHLFTGRDLSGGTIGIAYINSLCSDRFGVAVSQTSGAGTAGALTVAHEIGHNFGAPHDNQSGSPCASTPGNFIMNPFLNGQDQFSQCSLTQMQPAIQNAVCVRPIDVTPVADVRVLLPENPITATVDQSFDFQVEVSNAGEATAINVAVSITIPQGLTVEASDVNGGNCSVITGSVDCELNEISSSDVKIINLALQSSQTGNFVSTIQVSADNDENADNNNVDASFNIQSADDTGLFESHFDSDSEGFAYIDDAFRNTNQPDYAQGVFSNTSGFTGGGLRVFVGGRDNADILNMSGGWERSFTLENAENITLSFRYRLIQARNYESDEISEALVSIDGELIQNDGVDFLARIRGDGNGGANQNTGWQLVNIDLGQISSGAHTLRIGVFNNKKTYRDEASLLLIDDVVAARNSTPDDEPSPDDEPPTAQCPTGAKFATDGQDLNFCWFEDLPVRGQVRPYCSYLKSHQTIGYYFDINANIECPGSARSASNGQNLNFCLFENIAIPEGAEAECSELNTGRRIGYSFPR